MLIYLLKDARVHLTNVTNCMMVKCIKGEWVPLVCILHECVFTMDFFIMSYELRVGWVVGSWWWGWLFFKGANYTNASFNK